MPSAVLVFNKSSGFHLTGSGVPDETVTNLEAAGITVKVMAGEVSEQVAASLETPSDMVVVDGGDGTIRAVIEAHRGRGRPIGIIPGGTMNLLAKDFAVPTDRAEAASVIAAGHTRAIDYGTIDDHLFLHAAMTGLPVRVGIHRERRRGSLGLWQKLQLIGHAVTTLMRDPDLTLEASAPDGSPVTLKGPSFVLIVGTLAPQLLPLPHRASVTGEQITALSLHPDDAVDIARMLLRGATGDVAADSSVDSALIRRARLLSPRKRMRAMLDGEVVLLTPPCDIAVHAGEVEVFCPAGVGRTS